MNESLKTFLVGMPLMLVIPWFCLGFMTMFDAGQSSKGNYGMGKTFKVDFHEQRAWWASYYVAWGPAFLLMFIFPTHPWVVPAVGAVAACYGTAVWMYRSWDKYSPVGRLIRVLAYVLFNWLSLGISTWVVLDKIEITFQRERKERAPA